MPSVCCTIGSWSLMSFCPRLDCCHLSLHALLIGKMTATINTTWTSLVCKIHTCWLSLLMHTINNCVHLYILTYRVHVCSNFMIHIQMTGYNFLKINCIFMKPLDCQNNSLRCSTVEHVCPSYIDKFLHANLFTAILISNNMHKLAAERKFLVLHKKQKLG